MTYYDDIASGYNELHGSEQKKKLEIVKRFIKVQPEDWLLDVGCGTGVSSDFPCHVIGTDPSEKLIAQSSHLSVKAFAEKLPFPDHCFDLVVSLTAIQNFENITRGLSEIRRVGKDKFALSYLKRSEKAASIESEIERLFKVIIRIEEEKDIIFILS